MKLWKWFFMLSKRLYKKPSFLVLMLLIPACVTAFTVAAKQDSGFVHIVLAQEQADDKVASQVVEDLLAEKGAVLFTLAESSEAAWEAVKTGQAEEAWIFPADTETVTRDFVTGRQRYVVQVVTREQTVTAQLAREKISGAMYEFLAKAYYLDFVRSNFSQLDGVSDSRLIASFEEVEVSEELFVYGTPAEAIDGSASVNYLTSPVRGLLAVVMLLCGMAATLYYMQDETAGTFAWVRQNRKGVTALCCVVTATVNVAVIVLLSLCCSGLGGNVLEEMGALVLYSLCCGAFCLLLKEIFPTIRAYAATVPLMTVMLVGLCPVFLDFRDFWFFQLLLPPTCYINAAYDSRYMLYMLAYIPVCLAVAWLLSTLRCRRIQK